MQVLLWLESPKYYTSFFCFNQYKFTTNQRLYRYTHIEWLRVELEEYYRKVKLGLFHFTRRSRVKWGEMVKILPSDNIPSIPRIKATQYLFYITELTYVFFKSVTLWKITQLTDNQKSYSNNAQIGSYVASNLYSIDLVSQHWGWTCKTKTFKSRRIVCSIGIAIWSFLHEHGTLI